MASKVLLADDQFTILATKSSAEKADLGPTRDLKSIASAAEAVKGLRYAPIGVPIGRSHHGEFALRC